MGVARQYSGQLGKQDNCQVAVSLSLANAGASFPIAYRLYLPKDWAADPARRKKAGVPEEVTFRTKPEIALDQIRAALEAGAPPGVVLMDAGYGADTSPRSALAGLLAYVAGVQPHTSVWTRANPSPAVRPWSGRGRPTSRMVRDPDHQPQSVEGLALSLPAEAWEMISWREGSADLLISRFARVRVRAAHRDFDRSVPRDEEWLLVEWPTEEEKPTKFWLETLPENVAFDRFVALAKLRWRIERDYQELKQELGLGHFEGRGWRSYPSPCHPLHRRLRLPGRRTGEDSPLRTDASPRGDFQFPPVRPGDRPPIRPERHVANSISTMRRTLIVDLVRKLERCPCCTAVIRKPLTLFSSQTNGLRTGPVDLLHRSVDLVLVPIIVDRFLTGRYDFIVTRARNASTRARSLERIIRRPTLANANQRNLNSSPRPSPPTFRSRCWTRSRPARCSGPTRASRPTRTPLIWRCMQNCCGT